MLLAGLSMASCTASSSSDETVEEGTGAPPLSDPTTFEGSWYGLIGLEEGAQSIDSSTLAYEVELQVDGPDTYSGNGSLFAQPDGISIEQVRFTVLATREGQNLRIEQLDFTGESSKAIQRSGLDIFQCLTTLELLLLEGRLDGTVSAPGCESKPVTLKRPIELPPTSQWHETLPDCPCTLDLVAPNTSFADGRWSAIQDAEDEGAWVGYHPGAEFEVRWHPSISATGSVAGQQCTYDSNKNLVTGGLGAGTPDRVSPLLPGGIGLIDHWFADVRPFSDDATTCSVYLRNWPPNAGESEDGASCDSNIVSPLPTEAADRSCGALIDQELIAAEPADVEPSENPTNGEPGIGAPLVPSPASYTDPHLVTIDGLGYSFQAVGEFVLVRSALTGLEIQARQTQYGGPNSPVSVNSGFAFDVNGDAVSVMPSPTGILTIYVDDEPQSLSGELDLPEGGRVIVESETIQILWLDGSVAVITDRSRFLNLALALNDQHAGQVSGLLGDFDGNTLNDLMTNNGRDITTTPEANELYGEYADGWRVTDDTSLFTYFDGDNTATFTNRLLPGQVVSVDTLDDTVRENAAETCRAAGITNEALLQNCIVDIGVSGDTEFATALNLVQQELNSDIEPVVVQGEISVPTLVCNDQSALADFNAQYSGTFTNPDAGLVWDASLQLGQCSNDVVGLMTIESGSRFQNRRLLGTLNQNQITLDAGFPVSFDGLSACRDMQITLASSGTGLAGSWTASNCPRGGEINLPDITPVGSLSQAEIDQLMGTWIGPVEQPGSSIEYSAMLTFSQSEEGLLEGVINYPELACDTTLDFLGEEGVYLKFRETVVTNLAACVDQGSVSVRLDSSDTLEWLYRMPGAANVTARAQLARQ